MGPGGENTGILLRPSPVPSMCEMYQGILVGLQRVIPLILPFQAENPTLSPRVYPLHWGLSGLVFGSEDP